jgi:hypothetical protein
MNFEKQTSTVQEKRIRFTNRDKISREKLNAFLSPENKNFKVGRYSERIIVFEKNSFVFFFNFSTKVSRKKIIIKTTKRKNIFFLKTNSRRLT